MSLALLVALVLQAPVAPAPPVESCLARPVVIGASVAAGFGLGRPLGRALEASLGEPKDATLDLGDALFFLSPVASGKRQMEKALEAEPTLLVALDFLFWFGYGALDAEGGPIEDESERLVLLEVGLGLFADYEGPLVVADFPDMSAAVGRMLVPAQMPASATLARLSERVRAWAAARSGRTLVIPLAELVRSLGSEEGVTIGRHAFPAGTRLLQPDRLHPTLDGLLSAAQLVADELVRAGWEPEAAFLFELEPVRARLAQRR